MPEVLQDKRQRGIDKGIVLKANNVDGSSRLEPVPNFFSCEQQQSCVSCAQGAEARLEGEPDLDAEVSVNMSLSIEDILWHSMEKSFNSGGAGMCTVFFNGLTVFSIVFVASDNSFQLKNNRE